LVVVHRPGRINNNADAWSRKPPCKSYARQNELNNKIEDIEECKVDEASNKSNNVLAVTTRKQLSKDL
jgi:hypothetical protein